MQFDSIPQVSVGLLAFTFMKEFRESNANYAIRVTPQEFDEVANESVGDGGQSKGIFCILVFFLIFLLWVLFATKFGYF